MTKYYTEEDALLHLAKYPNDEFYSEPFGAFVACRLSVLDGDPIITAHGDIKLDLHRCAERNDWELVTKTYTTIQAMTMLLTDKTLRFVADETRDFCKQKLWANEYGDFIFDVSAGEESGTDDTIEVANRSDWRVERD